MPAILEKVLRFGEGRILKKLSGLAEQVNKLEPSFEDLSDEELREETDRFKERRSDNWSGSPATRISRRIGENPDISIEMVHAPSARSARL